MKIMGKEAMFFFLCFLICASVVLGATYISGVAGNSYVNSTIFYGNLNNIFFNTSTNRTGINDYSPDALLDININDPSDPGLIIQGYAGQSADLFDVRSNVPEIYFNINASGSTFYDGSEICTAANGNCNVNKSLIYGGMYNFTDNGWTLHLGSSGVYYNISNLTSGEIDGFTFSNNNSLVAQHNGVYKIDAQLSAVFGNNGEYGAGIAINSGDLETYPNSKCYTRIVGTGKTESLSVNCILNLTTGDYITMMLDDEAIPTTSITVYTVNVNAVKVG